MSAVVFALGPGSVVKVQDADDREGEHEAAALAAWDGDGAVRLLGHDQARRVLLLEACTPGTPLSFADADAALDVLIALLPRLWRPASSPFRPLAEEAADWIDHLPGEWERAGRPFERRLLDASMETLRELSASQGEQVLVHQDLHAGNVLAAEREPWLVIDPKPLLGEREFALAPIIRGRELGHSRRDVLWRLDRLTSELGLDRDRAKGWAFAHTVAWGFGDGGRVLSTHVDAAGWLLSSVN